MSATQDVTAVQTTRPYAAIVVGTDFTPCSAVAVGQAVRIAAWSGAPLHVVHVIDTTVVVELESVLSEYQHGVRSGLARDAEKAWGDFAAQIPGTAGLRLEVEINNRIFGILSNARRHKADLLVMGAFGERRPDIGFGTLATACVRKGMNDVLLVRDTQAGPFKCVVAAVDFSETSARAAARAAAFAARDGAELHVLHVFAAPWHHTPYLALDSMAALGLQQQYRDGLERRLAAFVAPLAEAHHGLRLRSICFEYSGHRSGIAEYATGVSADLIALGTRGRTNLRDILLGSTAEKALGESRCSVLAVKPEGFHHPLAAGDEQNLTSVRPQF